ncbi:phosphotransferase [Salaquimonas pukyongi]|uniref:phosphotransferase n=1 Tax=Salaquimonas pukyongi TaxID=2712698 RepID=UPI00096BCC8D|nr:phosphotransferase [Salaquimonas pukyongi]
MDDAVNQLDSAALSPWLESHVDGFHDLMEIRKFTGGQSNPTYLIIAQSGKYVLRAKPPGELLKSAHQVDREYRVMKALGATAVPVPRMFALSSEDSPIGRMFFVMEYLDGHIFWDPALPEIHEFHGEKAPERRALIYDRMNAAMAKLHDVDVEAAGLGDFGKPGNYFERQLARWTQQYAASEVDRNEELHHLIDWLGANMPEDDGRISLVHGDFRIDNMVFSHDAHEILGILDWELSTLGHPLADLAYQCMQWRLPHQGGFRGLGGLDRAALGLPSEEDYVAAYCRRRNIERPGNWPFYVAFCFFRIAAILQGVYKRSLDGNASNPQKAREYGKAVPVLGKMAVEMINKGS